MEPGLPEAAQLFKVLGNESRLWLLRLIGEEPRTVGMLADSTRMSQPLVSQHLRTLRQAGLVAARRQGKGMTYTIVDRHVSHVVDDAIIHVLEPVPAEDAEEEPQADPEVSFENRGEHHEHN